MMRGADPQQTALFEIPLFMLRSWEIGWAVELALWNDMLAPLYPLRQGHSCADSNGQLVIPEPIAEDDEHGLFA